MYTLDVDLIFIHVCMSLNRERERETHTLNIEGDYPWVEWRGLKIGGGNILPQKGVFCIFRCQSI